MRCGAATSLRPARQPCRPQRGWRAIVLIDHDLTDETRALLPDGRMDAAVVQAPEAEAEAAAEVMAALPSDPDTAQRRRVLPWQIVLRESLA